MGHGLQLSGVCGYEQYSELEKHVHVSAEMPSELGDMQLCVCVRHCFNCSSPSHTAARCVMSTSLGAAALSSGVICIDVSSKQLCVSTPQHIGYGEHACAPRTPPETTP